MGLEKARTRIGSRAFDGIDGSRPWRYSVSMRVTFTFDFFVSESFVSRLRRLPPYRLLARPEVGIIHF
jgi:hypothetical protein